MQIDARALDRHITGNYGEDQYQPRDDWAAGWNAPGCLPEMEPLISDWSEGRDYLIEALGQLIAESTTGFTLLAQAVKAREYLRKAQSGDQLCVSVGGYNYWLENA